MWCYSLVSIQIDVGINHPFGKRIAFVRRMRCAVVQTIRKDTSSGKLQVLRQEISLHLSLSAEDNPLTLSCMASAVSQRRLLRLLSATM